MWSRLVSAKHIFFKYNSVSKKCFPPFSVFSIFYKFLKFVKLTFMNPWHAWENFALSFFFHVILLSLSLHVFVETVLLWFVDMEKRMISSPILRAHLHKGAACRAPFTWLSWWHCLKYWSPKIDTPTKLLYRWTKALSWNCLPRCTLGLSTIYVCQIWPCFLLFSILSAWIPMIDLRLLYLLTYVRSVAHNNLSSCQWIQGINIV